MLKKSFQLSTGHTHFGRTRKKHIYCKSLYALRCSCYLCCVRHLRRYMYFWSIALTVTTMRRHNVFALREPSLIKSESPSAISFINLGLRLADRGVFVFTVLNEIWRVLVGEVGNTRMVVLPCSMNIFREFYFADWRFFCGLREQIFTVRDDWNFCWELSFAVLCSSSREAAHLIFKFYCTVCWVTFHSTYILETYPCNALLRKRNWIALHLHSVCFTYCFVGDTDYRMYLSSGCFFQWKILLMILFKSNVYRPSGTSLLTALLFNLTEGS